MNLYQKNLNEKIYSESIKDTQESLKLNPNYPKAYYIKAKLHFLKENNSVALKNMLIAKSFDPKNVDFEKLEEQIEAALLEE